MPSNLIFFDFDGVIVDTFSFCFRIVDSREYITEAEYRKRFEGNIFDAKRKLKDPGSTLESFFDQYTPELMKCEPVKEISEAIRELSKRYALVIVSSTQTGAIRNYLRAVGLESCFADILGSDVDKSKVNKIEKALREHKVAPGSAVFVTDALGDIREAEHCGVKAIAVKGGYNDEDTLKRGDPLAIVGTGKELVEAVEGYLGTKKSGQL